MDTVDVRKEGYLRRLKTQKRRYFVLRTLSASGKPKLEYYETEKKFRSNSTPKRAIQLISCFNIAQKDDIKYDFVFALYTRDDVFGLVCESKEDLQSWLDVLLKEQTVSHQGNEYSSDNVGDVQVPQLQRDYFASASHESSWPVIVKPRGLGTSKNLAGVYDLKLVEHTLSLQNASSGETAADFHLAMVRRCGHTDCFFFMEVGRSSITGAGEIWMQVDDPILAQHLHEVVLMAMQTLSSDGDASSMSRYRCHSGGIKPRPSSLLLLTPPRSRSDTLPDSGAISPDQDGGLSPTKQSSPSGSKRSAMFHRLMSVGKRKSEILDFSPRLFSRRTQSKSLSIEPCPGGLLGRTQSMDFSSLFSGSHLPNSPVTPDSPKERGIGFEIIEPSRTSSNSSGSSGRSWEQSLPRKHSFDERRDSGTLTPSPRPLEVPDEGYDSTSKDESPVDGNHPPYHSKDTVDDLDGMISRDDKTLEREPHDKRDNQHKDPFEESDDNSDRIAISPRSHSGYEDMTGLMGCVTIEESIEESDVGINQETGSQPKDSSFERETLPSQNSPLQRRTSAPTRSESPLREYVELPAKSSPKQRRTSEPFFIKSNGEFRELVSIRNSPTASPRRTKKNVGITDYTDSPPGSPRIGRRQSNDSAASDEYVEMGSFKKHTYMNLNPKEGYKPHENSGYMNVQPWHSLETPKESEESGYMNVQPWHSLETPKESEESGYMNFQPWHSRETPKESTESGYMNLRLGDSLDAPNESEEPAYMNFRPRGSLETPKDSKESGGCKNLQPRDSPDAPKESEEPAYMNFRPRGSLETPKDSKESGGCKILWLRDSPDAPKESEEPAYMNFRPGQTGIEPATRDAKSPSYVNFSPGGFRSTGRSESSSPRQKSKHTYENVTLNGTLKEIDDREFQDYMNVSPPKHSNKSLFNRKTLPSRRPTSEIANRYRRRESEPEVGKGLMSDEENGMLFFDFSGTKSTPSKELNYISLDLSKKDQSSQVSRPPHLNKTDYSLRTRDVGRPKSAPVTPPTSYAEVDFTKSHGLRQAIMDHKKTKTLKE